MKRFGKILLALVLVMAVAVIGFVAVEIVRTVKKGQPPEIDMSNILYDYDTLNQEKIYEQLSSEMSDIEGLTRQDKLDMGLSVRDGADTDQDGLTDKDEIELYGTDPTKKSTAGDFYLDGYKIEHDMDAFQYYEYDGEVVLKYNEVPDEVILTPVDAGDLNSSVETVVPESFNIEGYDVYKGYYIRNYPHTLEIETAGMEDLPDLRYILRRLLLLPFPRRHPLRHLQSRFLQLFCSFL